MVFTGSIQMKRVKWETKLEHEYINNYKLLQAAFKKLQVEQVIKTIRNLSTQCCNILITFLIHGLQDPSR